MNSMYNCFAYAEYISLYNSTGTGLQALIDICAVYAGKCRFNFGIRKCQCISAGYKPDCFVTEPIWYLNENIMETVTKLEILDVTFTNNDTCSDHVPNRVDKCRRAFYSLSNISMNYPGLNNNNKSQLYSSMCLLTLTYGMQCANLSSPDKSILNSAQGGIIKKMFGLSKRSRHTNILRAMNLDNVTTEIGNYTKSAFKRLCSKSFPTKNVCYHLLS